MDQRKVNMLAREYCDAAEPKIKFKPVILSHREAGASARARARPHALLRGPVTNKTNTFSLQP